MKEKGKDLDIFENIKNKYKGGIVVNFDGIISMSCEYLTKEEIEIMILQLEQALQYDDYYLN